MSYRFKRKRKLKFSVKVVLMILIVSSVLISADMHFKPLIAISSQNRAKVLAVTLINQAIYDEISKADINYSDLVHIERSSDNRVLSISADPIKMNKLKSSIDLKAQEKFLNNVTENNNLPLGTLLGSSLLTGKGPSIPLNVSLAGNILIDFSSKFESAGINQTKHQIFLDVNATVSVIVLGYNSSVDVKTNAIVAETVIVGEIPNVYANLDQDDASSISGLSRLAN